MINSSDKYESDNQDDEVLNNNEDNTDDYDDDSGGEVSLPSANLASHGQDIPDDIPDNMQHNSENHIELVTNHSETETTSRSNLVEFVPDFDEHFTDPMKNLVNLELDTIRTISADEDIVMESLQTLLENEEVILNNISLLSSGITVLLLLLKQYNTKCNVY